MKPLRVLVGCEFSGVVRRAFRARGHDAWSCDLLPAEDGSEFHIQGDVLEHLDEGWDLGIFHPPCTYLTVSGNKWMKPEYADRFPGRAQQREDAVRFFMRLADAPIGRVAVENPIGIMSTRWRKPDQVIQPWMFGHGEVKATCLWLKGLPCLMPTHQDGGLFTKAAVHGRDDRLHRLPPSEDRWKIRSTTYQGIAEAMADQWGSTSKPRKESHK